MKYQITIGWLYQDLMNTYGDRGNVICLKKRCEWRNIDCNIIELNIGFNKEELKKCDLLFMGGAQDRQQRIVTKDIKGEKSKIIKKMIDDDKVPGLFICGAYQFLGNYYKEADGKIIECLEILDLYTESPKKNKKRLIGNIALKSNLFEGEPYTLIGFENHGGSTYLGKNLKPLGKVMTGYGNNGEDNTEGVIFNNIIGTYLHGPILPKNPLLADFLIRAALKRKYKNGILEKLNDKLEIKARKAIANKLGVEL
ncbi:MAG: hypothetical protein M1268_03635 [Patescibacteria group bacterium]|nr:hypothetical protein [Patescibacteria group bacterium]